MVIAKKEPPPPPPPRPYRAHMRSSSLDLNKLGNLLYKAINNFYFYYLLFNIYILGKFGAVSSTQGPPVVPPRITPSPVNSIIFQVSNIST